MAPALWMGGFGVLAVVTLVAGWRLRVRFPDEVIADRAFRVANQPLGVLLVLVACVVMVVGTLTDPATAGVVVIGAAGILPLLPRIIHAWRESADQGASNSARSSSGVVTGGWHANE